MQSPMAKTLFHFFSKDQSLLHRSRNSGREGSWWSNSIVGLFVNQLSLVQSLRSIQGMQTVPLPKQLNRTNYHFLRRSSLCLTDPETQEENVLGGPTPLRVSSYTSYLLYKVQDPLSACRRSNGQNIKFLVRTSLCFTDQETQEENVLGGPTPLWVSSLVQS